MIRKLKIVLLITLVITSAKAYTNTTNTSDSNGYSSYFYEYLTNTSNHNFEKSVTIGFLGAYGDTQVVLGALPLAVAAVNEDADLLPGRHLAFVAADIGSTRGRKRSWFAANAIRAMTEMRDKGTIAFIGPDDTCSAEALVAAAWNLPMISYKCADKVVSDKKVFFTFARTLPPSTKVSKSVVALLQAFQWQKFVVVAGRIPAWGPQIKDAIKDLAVQYGLEVTGVYEFGKSKNYIPKYIAEMERIVIATYQTTRVYVFVGEHIALVDFVLCLQRQHLLDLGEYIVISVDDEIYDPEHKSNIIQRRYLDPFIGVTKDNLHSFRSVLKLTPSHPRNPHYKELWETMRNFSAQEPFLVPYHEGIFDTIQIPIHAAHLYDAVMIYARALTEIFKNGEDPRNGSAIVKRILNRSYDSVQGHTVYIDENGDAEGNFSVVALLDDKEVNGSVRMSMQPVGYFQFKANTSELPEFKYYDEKRIQWVGGKQPLAEPICGFSGRGCIKPRWKMDLTVLTVGFFLTIAIAACLKHYRYEQKLACLLWKIDIKDVSIIPTTETIPSAKTSMVSTKLMRDARHENIIPFIGACVDAGNICILTIYCARGSLEDVLANEDLHLDNMFVSSLVADIIKGMIYLHDSEIVSHGNLRSSNCLVDSRWVLQITDFGLHEFKGGQDESDALVMKRRLWKAPELLRNPHSPPRGTQKGDVYSFGILLYEIVGRIGPWGRITLADEEIVTKVMRGVDFRPNTSLLDIAESVLLCMKSCWSEDPESRPDFRFVRVKLKEMQAGLKPNIFDNMLAMMEKYAYNLEGQVQQRTNELTEEKKKTDALLNRMLPRTVAEALKRGDPVEAESFSCVTIYFSDIVGFTELSAVSTPLQVVGLLNDLYTCFDSIISNYDVYKVETIGDAYMVVSGLPVSNGDRHAVEIASMALHLLSKIRRFEIRHIPGELLRLRIGIHSGPCVAGVVGLKMPRYCLFGDTVNTASRMESTGDAFRIHISHTTFSLLEKHGGFICEQRGWTQIKGKGQMLTHWLIGEEIERSKARLRESNQSIQSSKRLSETPDLLRQTGNDLVSHAFERTDAHLLSQLHLRAVKSCSGHHSQEMLIALSKRKMSPARRTGYHSAPVITFKDTSFA
ncbi:guanylate cyclase 32E [Nilaparvata lugens]|uniref:guanylate cyclase 32E n=1 Tax=Nilaparvata lugens TaxID=108931 RepID=UPI00193E2C83|nr:guanylate cyclase 32E [Nilaparvata lugens]